MTITGMIFIFIWPNNQEIYISFKSDRSNKRDNYLAHALNEQSLKKVLYMQDIDTFVSFFAERSRNNDENSK